MFWNKYLLPTVAVLVLVSALNFLGLAHNYYVTTNWYDFVMHFLGGLGVSLCALWAAKTFGAGDFFTPVRLILFAIAIGLSWEAFELVSNITSFADVGYAWNTTHDMLMDIAGGVVAAIIHKLIK
jgi:hypothetical protein